MKKICLILFPFLFTIMSIGVFFANKEYIDNLDAQIEAKQYNNRNSNYSQEMQKNLYLSSPYEKGLVEMEKYYIYKNETEEHLIEKTGFNNNSTLYIITLIGEALIFMATAFLIQLLNKLKPIKTSWIKIMFTILCLIVSLFGSSFLGVFSIDILCDGFLLNLSHAEYDMLFTFATFFESFDLISYGGIYILYGFLAILFQIYTIYVIWAIINKGD